MVSSVKVIGSAAAVLVLVGGCTSTPVPVTSQSPVPPSTTGRSPSGEPAPPFVIPAAPGPSSTTLALSTYESASGVQSTRGSSLVDPSAPYAVQVQCLSDTPDRTVGYEAAIDGVDMSSGQVPCDGGLYLDSAFAGSGGEATYSIQLSGTQGVTRAYAAIVPAPNPTESGS